MTEYIDNKKDGRTSINLNKAIEIIEQHRKLNESFSSVFVIDGIKKIYCITTEILTSGEFKENENIEIKLCDLISVDANYNFNRVILNENINFNWSFNNAPNDMQYRNELSNIILEIE